MAAETPAQPAVVEAPASPNGTKPEDSDDWEYTPMSQWDDVDEKAELSRYTSVSRGLVPAFSALMDYAIIRVGNKQHRVRDGETLVVDRVHTDEGKTFDAGRAAR